MKPNSQIISKTTTGIKRRFLSNSLPYNNDKFRQKRGPSLIDSNVFSNSSEISMNDDTKESSYRLSQHRPLIKMQTISRTKENLSNIKEMNKTVTLYLKDLKFPKILRPARNG